MHCFQYGRAVAKELNTYCEQVHYYPRLEARQSLPLKLPHIVASRSAKLLLNNLVLNDYPILFEGLHTCYYLHHPLLKERFKMVRMHNIEWDYYNRLFQSEKKWWKKTYFFLETLQLQRFEKVLHQADCILGISPNDAEYLKNKYGKDKVSYLPGLSCQRNGFVQNRKGPVCSLSRQPDC